MFAYSQRGKPRFRHNFGKSAHNLFLEDVRATSSALDGNFIKVNKKYIAMIWESSPFGQVGIFPIHQKGRVPANHPLLEVARPVLDLEFNPFEEVCYE